MDEFVFAGLAMIAVTLMAMSVMDVPSLKARSQEPLDVLEASLLLELY
jgi:hypothetical protein